MEVHERTLLAYVGGETTQTGTMYENLDKLIPHEVHVVAMHQG